MIKISVVKCLKNINYHKFHFKEGELYLLINNLKGNDYIRLYENTKKNWLCVRSAELYDKDLKEFFGIDSTIYFPSKRSLNLFAKGFKDIEVQKEMMKEALMREEFKDFILGKGAV